MSRGSAILATAQEKGLEVFRSNLSGRHGCVGQQVFSGARERLVGVPRHLTGKDANLCKGAEIACAKPLLHLPSTQWRRFTCRWFSTSAGTEWMLKDDERLIKLTLKGLIGLITVKGVSIPAKCR